jgi:DNA end-binding protein Ku
MAPRANWKGFLRLSLVTCPVALYPATSDTEKVSFNQINRKTGHRIKYAKVDAETGEEVASDDIMKGYKVDADTYIEVSKDELDDIALESTHTIEIDEFVPKGKGLMGTLLRYPYEVRSEKEYFDDIQDVKVTRDMLDLARHIVEKKSGAFEPGKFEDHYESALIDLINKKRSGVRLTAKATPKSGGNVINLMDALKRSLAGEQQSAPPARAKGKKPRKAAAGQREMLLPISGSGKRAAKEEPKKAEKQVRAPARSKKTG